MAKRIHQYRPQRSSLEDLEFIFVARENLLSKILDHLRKWEVGASRQHYLLIGPRGIGKTHVINLIDHRISKDKNLRKKWESLVFPEEAYGITRVSDLLVIALKILSERASDSEIRNAYEAVRYDDDHQRVTDRALDAFRKFHQSSGKSLLIMLENVNRLFERQIKDKKEIHLFRKILIEEDWLLTVCTSPTYLNAVSDAEEPLFEFFQIEFLSELTFNEQYELLQKLAEYENNDRFKAYLEQYRSRLRALYHFSGGNPRLTIMLYELISYHSIVDVQDELEGLIDQITPFYQGRMKDIGEQEGKLMEAMSLMPEGCSPSELALEARMPAKTVRALLTRLQKAGYVRPEQRRKKKTVYIIPERLFRIWHQMNHSRYVRGLIQYLLEFFSTWYETRKERDIVWDELTEKLEQRTETADDERSDELNQYLDYLVAVSEGGERYEREFDRLRIDFKDPILPVENVIAGVSENLERVSRKIIKRIIRNFLRSAFSDQNLKSIREIITSAKAHLDLPDQFYLPYDIALEFLESEEAPVILERQHPEMREAVLMLVDLFKQGEMNTEEFD